MKKILEIKNLYKYYGTASNLTKAINGLSFDVEEGEFVAIMGASGSGKTTLLNCVSTIDKASDGQIIVNGVEITSLKGKEMEKFRKNELGFIFQDFNLIDALNAYDNIALPLSIQKMKHNEQHQHIIKIAKRFQLEDHLLKYPYQLSGGQKQRVASARAIVKKPSLVLADEPTGALDSKNTRYLLETLKNLNEELHTTILLVTHDALAASYSKRIIFMKDGKIYNQIYLGDKTREQYFNEIMSVVKLLGGE